MTTFSNTNKEHVNAKAPIKVTEQSNKKISLFRRKNQFDRKSLKNIHFTLTSQRQILSLSLILCQKVLNEETTMLCRYFVEIFLLKHCVCVL